MTGFVTICFLIGFAIAAIIVGIAKGVITRDESYAPPDDSDDITSPGRSWHPLNMWNDDN